MKARSQGRAQGDDGVGRKLTPEELEKAVRNLEKIEAYLAPRARLTADRAGVDAIASLQRSIGRLASRASSWWADTSARPADGRPTEQELLAADDFDSAQLASFAAFLERLDRWFETSGALPPDAGSTDSVERFVRSLHGIERAIDELTGVSRTARAPSTASATAPAAAVAAEREAGPSPVVDNVYEGAPVREHREPPAPAEQIAITASDANPMFRWVGPEEIELTEQAREQIEQLFAEQGITLFRYQLEKFIDEVQRRVMSAPEGHVLVIKVRNIGGERKPFLSYVSANALGAS